VPFVHRWTGTFQYDAHTLPSIRVLRTHGIDATLTVLDAIPPHIKCLAPHLEVQCGPIKIIALRMGQPDPFTRIYEYRCDACTYSNMLFDALYVGHYVPSGSTSLHQTD
jgi:hypothetical protein